MLYEIVVDSYGDTTYVPATLGNVLLVAVVLVLLAAGLFFARKHSGKDSANVRSGAGKLTVKQLAFCACAMALGTVLSNVKLFSFPWSGSRAYHCSGLRGTPAPLRPLRALSHAAGG